MQFFAPDIGIDLGTSNTLLYVRKRGTVINEPTLVAVEGYGKRATLSIGDEAQYMIGRTKEAKMVVHPIKGGYIDDFEHTEQLLRYFIRKAIGNSHLVKPRVVVAVPSNLPEINRKAVAEATRMAGAKKVYLIEKPFAAAIGSGLPVYEPIGSMVVDIGGGTTDAAIVSLGGLVISHSVQVGGVKMDEAIVNYIKSEFRMLIGDKTAEDLKLDLASAIPMPDSRQVMIRGRDLRTPQPMEIAFTSNQAIEAINEPCRAIIATIKWVLERTPPELAADVMRRGIHLTGGVSQLFGIDEFIGQELGIPVLVANNAEECTILGLGYLVENLNELAEQGRLPQPM